MNTRREKPANRNHCRQLDRKLMSPEDQANWAEIVDWAKNYKLGYDPNLPRFPVPE